MYWRSKSSKPSKTCLDAAEETEEDLFGDADDDDDEATEDTVGRGTPNRIFHFGPEVEVLDQSGATLHPGDDIEGALNSLFGADETGGILENRPNTPIDDF